MSAVASLKGKAFGTLTVIERVENNMHKKAQWLCRCRCGGTTIVPTGALRSGNTSSCGCLRLIRLAESNREKKSVHGLYGTPLYVVWQGMKKRCNNETNKSYRWYGNRGISVCEEWVEFLPFYNWAIENGYAKGLHLDRIDSDGDYEPSNCRFVTCKENQRNKRNNVKYRGVAISKYCEEHGLEKMLVYSRLRAGWDLERAINTPKRGTKEAAASALAQMQEGQHGTS